MSTLICDCGKDCRYATNDINDGYVCDSCGASYDKEGLYIESL